MKRYRKSVFVRALATILPLAAARADGAKLCMFDDHKFNNDPEHQAIAQLPYLTHAVIQINWAELQPDQTIAPDYTSLSDPLTGVMSLDDVITFWNTRRDNAQLPPVNFIFRLVPFAAPGNGMAVGTPAWVYDFDEPALSEPRLARPFGLVGMSERVRKCAAPKRAATVRESGSKMCRARLFSIRLLI